MLEQEEEEDDHDDKDKDEEGAAESNKQSSRSFAREESTHARQKISDLMKTINKAENKRFAFITTEDDLEFQDSTFVPP